MARRNTWPRFLCRYLTGVWLSVLLSLLGCFHHTQTATDQQIASHAKLRPIDLDPTTAEQIGQEALRKIGYEEIVKLAEQAGFVAYKSDVTVQLASYGAVAATGFAAVFSRYAAAAAVTSQADSPLPGPADVAALGIIVVGLVDAGVLDGHLLNTLGGWLFSQTKAELPTESEKVEFPSASQLARKLGVSEAEFHRQIKPGMVQDLAPEARRLGTKNPDIGVDRAGRVVLRNPQTGATVVTDVGLESYIP